MRKRLLIGLIFSALLVLLLAAPSLASSGSNVVDITSPSSPSIQLTGATTAYVLLTENSLGLLGSNGAASVTLTLPNGFSWGTYSVLQSVYSQYSVSAYSSNNGRTYNIITNGTTQTGPDKVIFGAPVYVTDQLVAPSGDVICQVGGVSNVSATTLKIGTYSAPVNVVNNAIHVTSSTCPTISSGKLYQATGNITITEDSAGQLLPGRTINFILPEGAIWDTTPWPSTTSGDATLSYGGILANHPNIYQAVVNCSSTSASTIIIRNGTIALSADFAGDLNVTVSGSAGASAVVKLATVVPPVTAALVVGAAPAQIICGVQEQALPDITITETKAGAISSTSPYNFLIIEFPAGVTPSLPTVQVTTGDIVMNSSSFFKYLSNTGRWYFSMAVLYSSTQPSTITLSNIKVTVDQSVPVGPLKLSIGGSSLVETATALSTPPYTPAYFPSATVAATVTAGQVYLTAPVVNSGILLSGLVQVENGYDSGVTVSLVNASTGSTTLQAFTDASGNYQFANVAPGTYNVVVSHKGFLNATASTITVSTSAVSAPTLSMKAGDLNGDNRIDLLDIATFAKNYGSVGN